MGLDGKELALVQSWQDRMALGFWPPGPDYISSLTLDGVALNGYAIWGPF